MGSTRVGSDEAGFADDTPLAADCGNDGHGDDLIRARPSQIDNPLQRVRRSRRQHPLAWPLLSFVIALACALVSLPLGPSSALAVAAAPVSDLPFRQASPDLTVTKTNNVGGSVAVGTPWTWTATIANAGAATASFTSGQIVLADNLPNANVTYGTPTVTPSGGATGLDCAIDFTFRLTCSANAGGVSMPPGSSFQVAFTAQASVLGPYANPRAGTTCLVDPNNNVAENNENNNSCADTVTALGPDLTVTKTNNVGGAAQVGATWTWTVTIANTGPLAATFTNGQIVLADNLPNANVAYSTTVVTPSGGATGLDCAIDFTFRLTCSANAGGVSMPPGSSFQVAFTAMSSAPGVFANPRAGSTCLVDPNNSLVENNEGNNACSDTVRAGPDLTATLTNNVHGSTFPGAPWTWTLTLASTGTTAVTFTNGQALLFDHLPDANVTYGTPTVSTLGGASGPIACAIDFTIRLACFASGGVSMPPGSSFQITFTATATANGTFANPRAGSTCLADPTNRVVEASESNNACTDTVTVGAPGAAGSVPAESANDGNDDDKSSQRRLTERQRFEHEHTSAAGEDDYRTEGDVLEVRCDTSSSPQYDVTFPTYTPYLVIATRDGNQQLRLLYDTKTQCQSTQVGDYAEADGEKQTEQLFDVHDLTVKHRR